MDKTDLKNMGKTVIIMDNVMEIEKSPELYRC